MSSSYLKESFCRRCCTSSDEVIAELADIMRSSKVRGSFLVYDRSSPAPLGTDWVTDRERIIRSGLGLTGPMTLVNVWVCNIE